MSTYWSGMIMQAPLFGIPISVDVTGVSAIADAGNVRVGISASGTGSGVVATGSIGTVSFIIKGSTSPTGVSATGLVGSVSGATVDNPLTAGVVGTGQIGTVDFAIGEGVSVEVLGVGATTQLSSVSSWGEIPDSVIINWIPIE